MRIFSIILLLLPWALVAQPTFYEDVAPIIVENCVECHRKGQTAPFPLLTYEEVKAKAKLVQFVTQTRYMPPWIADHTYRDFDQSRRLTDKEIKTIKDWVKGGKLAGSKSNMPKIPTYAKGSKIGRKPDLVLTMQQPFVIPGNNKETFAVIKFVGELPEDMSVEAIEFIPDNDRLVHHVNYEVLPLSDKVDMNAGNHFIDLNTYDYDQHIYRYLNLVGPDEKNPELLYYSGWVPGMSPQVFKGDLGFTLPKRFVVLINSIHYDVTPVDDIDNSKFYVFFKKEEVKRPVKLMNIGSGGVSKIEPPLEIPPNKIKTFKTKWKVAEDITALYIAAHMHLLGKSYKAYAVPPLGNDTIPLLRINEWDFNWQEIYRLDPGLKIRKGTTIYVEGTYDNTASNPLNPFSPPQTISSTGFMETTNEMLNLMMLYVQDK